MRKRLLVAVAILLSASLGARADVFTTFIIEWNSCQRVDPLRNRYPRFHNLSFHRCQCESEFARFTDVRIVLLPGLHIVRRRLHVRFYSSTGFPVLAMVVVGNTLVGYNGGAIGSSITEQMASHPTSNTLLPSRLPRPGSIEALSRRALRCWVPGCSVLRVLYVAESVAGLLAWQKPRPVRGFCLVFGSVGKARGHAGSKPILTFSRRSRSLRLRAWRLRCPRHGGQRGFRLHP